MIYQIIPDINVENKGVGTLLENIHVYRNLKSRLKIKADKDTIAINIDKMGNYSYEIYIDKENIEFFFSFPEEYKDLVDSELNQCWPKSTFKVVSGVHLKRIDNRVSISQLELQHHYFLSLRVDKRGLFPLSSIMEVQRLLKQDDFALVQVVLEPETPYWYLACEDAIKEFHKGYMVKKLGVDRKNIINGVKKFAVNFLYETASVIHDFLIDEELEYEPIRDQELTYLFRNGLSNNTQQKPKYSAYNTDIRLTAYSRDKQKQGIILRNLEVAFRSMKEDNYFVARKVKEKRKARFIQHIRRRIIPHKLNKNILSTNEISQIMQLPTKSYQVMYKLYTIDTREIDVPAELMKGSIRIGEAVYKGHKRMTYWPPGYNVLALPKVIIGPMGAGKTEYAANFAVDAVRSGDSVVVFDYIKNCELSRTIASNLPREKVISIRLDKDDMEFALAYPEASAMITEDMGVWERLKIANQMSEQTRYLINSLTDETTQPLTSRMHRYLNAACQVVYIHPGARLWDVVQVLTNWKTRNEYIRKAKYSGCFEEDDIEIQDLLALHERDDDGRIIGTKEHLITGIMDRINIILRNIYLKRMLKAEINPEHNFIKWFREGKCILIQMPELVFNNKQVKDTLVTFFLSRIILCRKLMSGEYRPPMTHVITDEIHQVPTAAALLTDNITELRKFGLDMVFTIHYLKQFRKLLDAVKSAGVSYMLLAGTEKENLVALAEEISPFTVEEGLQLKAFHSLNVINYGNQYARFVSRLPRPLQTF